MKTIIAIILSMLLLLSGCAYDGAEAPGVDILFSDLIFAVDQTPLADLEGASVDVAVGSSGQASGLRLTVSSGDGQENVITLALLEDALLIELDSAAGEAKTYAVDSDVLRPALSSVLGGMSGVLEQTLPPDTDGELPADEDGTDGELPAGEEDGMTDEQWQQAMQELESELDAMGLGGMLDAGRDAGESEQPERPELSDQLFDIFMDATTEEGEMQFNGESYETARIDLDHDTLVEIMTLIYADSPFQFDFAQILAEAGITLHMSCTIAANIDASKWAVGMELDMADSDETDTLTLSVQNMADDGTVDIYTEVSSDDGKLLSIGLSIKTSPLEQVDWLPTAVSADARFLTEEDAAALDDFTEDLSDLFGQIAGSILGIEVGNQAINGLERVAP